MKSLQALFTAIVKLFGDSLKWREAARVVYERVSVYDRDPRRKF